MQIGTFKAYCLFCRTGREARLGQKIEQRLDGVKALAAVQEKHKYINGQYEIDRRVFLPGYLFYMLMEIRI